MEHRGEGERNQKRMDKEKVAGIATFGEELKKKGKGSKITSLSGNKYNRIVPDRNYS